MVLGDRWELLYAVPPVVLLGVPLVHLHGGEVTEGAIDDRVRHAVSKLADLHCVSTEAAAAARLRQLGEPAERIVVTGAPSLDRVAAVRPAGDATLERHLGRPARRPLALVTYHPSTAGGPEAGAGARAVLAAVAATTGSALITHPGLDSGREAVLTAITAAERAHPTLAAVASLGTDYLPVLAACDVVVGNSSSGILEAASFGVPVVNVGDRQRGRESGVNVVDAAEDQEAIEDAIRHCLDPDFRLRARGAVNVYGDGRAAGRILDQGLLPVLQLLGTLAQLLGQLLRLLQQPLGLGVDADGVDAGRDHLGDLVQEVLLDLREGLEGGQLDDAEDLPLEEHRQHEHVRRRRLAQARGDLQVAGRHVSTWMVRFSSAAVPIRPSPGRKDVGIGPPSSRNSRASAARTSRPRPPPVPTSLRRAGRQREEEGAVLRGDHRRQLAHDQRRHVLEVPAALHQAGDPREVALEPVLLLVGEGGVPQVRDHRVDVVLEVLDLARRVHVDLHAQVAAGHRGGHVGDRAHLTGQVPGHLVDGLGQVAPGAVDVPDPRLAAQLALGAHLAGHPRHLRRRRRTAGRPSC